MAEYAQALSLCLSLLAGIVLIALWYDYYTDEVRNDLFALRDEMFLYAYRNNLTANIAHRELRALMNSVIRYAHEISLPRFIFLVMAHAKFKRQISPDPYRAWREAVEQLPDEHRATFLQFHTRLSLLITRQLFQKSVVLRVAAWTLMIFAYLSRTGGNGKKKVAEHLPADPALLFERDALAAGR